jgi:hypothetical protein
VDLALVTTLHRGQMTPRFLHTSRHLLSQPNIEQRSFSLLTSDGRSLDLIAPSVEIAEEWIRCLQFLIFDIYVLREDLYKIWCLMVTGEGIKEQIDDLDIMGEIMEQDIKEDLMSIRNFVSYWTSLQDPRYPPRRILRDIDQCLPGLRVTCEYFTFQAFFCLMTSHINSGYDLSRVDKVYQDMTQPLSHYFIHSSDHLNIISHAKTTEDYLSSYRSDLENGCRGIELHCWDGKDTPVVTSYLQAAPTSSSSTSSPSSVSQAPIEVPLEEVLKVIKTYAFVTSPYPLVLFIENHCTLRMQEMIAYYVLALLGEHLVPANEIAYGSDDTGRHLPSPEDLYEKVILVLSDHRHSFSTVLDDGILKQKTLRPISAQILSTAHSSNASKNGEEESKSTQSQQLSVSSSQTTLNVRPLLTRL